MTSGRPIPLYASLPAYIQSFYVELCCMLQISSGMISRIADASVYTKCTSHLHVTLGKVSANDQWSPHPIVCFITCLQSIYLCRARLRAPDILRDDLTHCGCSCLHQMHITFACVSQCDSYINEPAIQIAHGLVHTTCTWLCLLLYQYELRWFLCLWMLSSVSHKHCTLRHT